MEALSVVEKTFVRALGELVAKPQLLKSFLKDHRITQTEKIILRASLDIRSGKHREVVSTLKDLPTTSEVVESQRLFYLGSAYNNLCDYPRAIDCFKKSLELGRKYCIHFRNFSIVYYLTICYLNLKDSEQVKTWTEKLSSIGARNSKEAIDLLFAQYYSVLLEGDLNLAKIKLNALAKELKSMSEHQKLLFHIERFDLAIKHSEYSEAQTVLEDLKRIKKFYNPTTYKFMKSLLDHLTDDKEIYLYDRDFSGQPGLYAQMKVLVLLRDGNAQEAATFWRMLSQTAPSVYLENFNYQGDRCLFSLCLEKNLKQERVELSVDHSKTKEENLLLLLQSAKGPVPKERIFELIYGQPLASKDDLHRLATLVYQVRSRTRQNIKTQKGCYLLVA